MVLMGFGVLRLNEFSLLGLKVGIASGLHQL